jgi:hypothetical protein
MCVRLVNRGRCRGSTDNRPIAVIRRRMGLTSAGGRCDVLGAWVIAYLIAERINRLRVWSPVASRIPGPFSGLWILAVTVARLPGQRSFSSPRIHESLRWRAGGD